MKIAWGRMFVRREALEGTAGRFRTRFLASGQKVRLLKRLGRGLYVCEPLPLTELELLSQAQHRFEEWAVKHLENTVLYGASHIGKIHVSAFEPAVPCEPGCQNPVHFHLGSGAPIAKLLIPKPGYYLPPEGA